MVIKLFASTVALLVALASSQVRGEDLLLADGQAWPGRLLVAHGSDVEVLHVREEPPQDAVPRLQSVTVLNDGRIVVCSGLDRMLFELTSQGERPWHHGGYLARQVRTDTDGTLYWSGLETPGDGAPLPDGFIYSWNAATSEQRTLLTFSQGDVGHDWWGAFEVAQGEIYVGTLANPTRIYNVSVSPVRLVATLPFGAPAFRLDGERRVWACDGQGRLFRFGPLANVGPGELVLTAPTPFTDFAFRGRAG